MEDKKERARRGETRSFYRVPSRGTTAKSRQIAQDVDDEGWQKFRHSLKGIDTVDKLTKLKAYLLNGPDDMEVRARRVHNYLGALARGGQIRLKGEFRTDFSHVVVLKKR